MSYLLWNFCKEYLLPHMLFLPCFSSGQAAKCHQSLQTCLNSAGESGLKQVFSWQCLPSAPSTNTYKAPLCTVSWGFFALSLPSGKQVGLTFQDLCKASCWWSWQNEQFPLNEDEFQDLASIMYSASQNMSFEGPLRSYNTPILSICNGKYDCWPGIKLLQKCNLMMCDIAVHCQ